MMDDGWMMNGAAVYQSKQAKKEKPERVVVSFSLLRQGFGVFRRRCYNSQPPQEQQQNKQQQHVFQKESSDKTTVALFLVLGSLTVAVSRQVNVPFALAARRTGWQTLVDLM